MLESIVQDMRHAARSLRKTPGFTAVAVLTLALGIGANTVVFSIVDGALLRPPPYPDAEELVTVKERTEAGGENSVAGANFLDWRSQSRSFEHLIAYGDPRFGTPVPVLGGDEAVRVSVSRVTRGFFDMMGVEPVVGRTFTDEEYAASVPSTVVVGHALWRTQLGATRDLASRRLEIFGIPVTVVGVMPPGFDHPAGTQVWAPQAIAPGGSRTSHNLIVMGRLRDGVTLDRARADLDAITRRLKAEHGSEMNAASASVVRLQDALMGSYRQPLYLLLGAAAFVLLVACTNLASALLARGARRAREIAVRASLGANRGRITRQLLVESLVLGLLGAGAAVALAGPLLDAFMGLGPAALRDTVDLNLRVLGFSLAAGILTAVLFGLLPARRTSRLDLGAALRSGDRRSTGGDRRAWKLLVAGEVALALMLLVGSGLLIRSFAEVLAVEPGFDSEQVLTAEVAFPSGRYADDPVLARAQAEVLRETRSVPGVVAAGMVNHVPLGGVAFNGGFEAEGRTGLVGSMGYRVASTGYFEAMGIPVIEGRTFTEGDDADVADVAVISRSAADRFWPDESPIGKRIRNLRNDSWIYPDRWITIVGVVGDVRHHGLTEASGPTVYVNTAQRPARNGTPAIAIRAAGPPASLTASVRSAVRRVDPDLPVSVTTMRARIADSVTDRRFTMSVLGTFALVALLLAGVGIYGVVSYAVAGRTREIGIRMAFGASAADILGTVVGGSMKTVLIGAGVGIVGALALSRLLQSLLYGIGALDPATFAGVTALLLGVAALASFLPARRAARVDPIRSLRSE